VPFLNQLRVSIATRSKVQLPPDASAPDLTHLMSRETIAAGAAMNTEEHLKIWIKDPSLIKPGAFMPAMNLDDKDSQ
jgi:cytochrome c1